MTEKQEKKFYFPRWHQVCRAQAWRVQAGRVALADSAPEPANTVICAARRLAEQAHRAITIDDLRHATHVVACGRNCSHSMLRNHELTRWGWLARLLINPDDLEAMNHWLHPDLDEIASLDARIDTMPEAIVRSITANRFQRSDWRSLDLEDKRALLIQLKNRSERGGKPFGTAKERVAA